MSALINSQNVAADPRASSFLTANAGSGKTSTLVNRVARLLLNGAKPEHILCVTYTKAAAAEMQGRLFERLGGWAIAADDDLRRDLAGIDESVRDLAHARALFASALETPGGLKIQTIHAFCEKLLRRFPLEAGLSPAFQVLDDLIGQKLANDAIADVLTRQTPEPLAQARDRLIRKLKVAGFEKLLAQFIAQHDDIAESFAALTARHGDWQHALFHSLGLDGVCTSHDCLDAYAGRIEWTLIKDLAASLSAGTSKTNTDAGRAFFELHLHFQSGRGFNIDLVKPVFFTKGGGARKAIYTKETATADALLLDRMAAEIATVIEQLKAAEIAGNTLDALLLFQYFSLIYTSAKRDEGALDFQDLINKTKALLLEGDMSTWVLFKLDGGLEHILVDEAQDTSEDQWAIVKALSAEFFTGRGQAEGGRTVFAVGDEKQSIYGFQGADPEIFLVEGQYFEGLARAAGQKFVAPELVESWRSLPQILGFVDAVFDAPDLSQALNFTSNRIVHEAKRIGHNGLVELWPLVAPIDAPDATADDDDVAPVDAPGNEPPQRRLARQLAATIKSEIDLGRSVWTKGKDARPRPMHAGDVLVLVRKRDAVFEHIIRELKMAGVPVSGADRLKLGEHIAFQDLRALLRFCLQPHDDLSLACVLRSPLCDVSEDALFRLGHGRRVPLWQALLHHPDTDGPFDAARLFLLWAQKAALHLTAFDFLARVLNRRDLAGRSFKQRFLTRLGDECEDVLDETLALALKGEGVGATGLSACLDLFEFHAAQIKREQEEGGSAVRVMTVHGSKGLEAPWVILPIGPQHSSARKDDLLLTGAGGELYLCAGGRKGDTANIADMRAVKALKDDREGLRLLYVALTRARDRLTLCGFAGKKAAARGAFPAWYDLAVEAFDRLPEDQVRLEVMPLKAPFDDLEQSREAVVRLYGEHSPLLTAEAAQRPAIVPLPDFVTAMAAHGDGETERWQAISQLGDEDRDSEDRAPSPLESQTGLGRYRRGNLIHKLFEILPDIAADKRDEVAARYLAKQVDLDDAQRREMAGAVMAVLNDARFAEAFGPDSRPEVALAGRIGEASSGQAVMLSGRIDRLVVTADRVLVIDYKSNRPAPDRAEDAAIAYQRQMAGYVALLRQIYPAKTVEAALLWTDGPRLTPLSEALVNLRLGEVLSR